MNRDLQGWVEGKQVSGCSFPRRPSFGEAQVVLAILHSSRLRRDSRRGNPQHKWTAPQWRRGGHLMVHQHGLGGNRLLANRNEH